MAWAKVRGRSGDAEHSESFWWQDVIGHRFGKTTWVMALDVHPTGGASYRVQDEFHVPNKLFRLRDMAKGRPHFRSGMALPVDVDDRNPAKVTIDWDAFAARGGVAALYGADESVSDSVRSFVADVRSRPAAPAPDVSRPTATTHPPVEGVDFDQWVGAVLSVPRRMDAAALDAHYQSHGFPAGRGDEISATWYERVKIDPVLNVWYLYEQETQ